MAAFYYRLCAFTRAQRASFTLIDTIANLFDLWTTHDSFSSITISQAYSRVAYLCIRLLLCSFIHLPCLPQYCSTIWSLFYSFPIHCLSVIRYRITYTYCPQDVFFYCVELRVHLSTYENMHSTRATFCDGTIAEIRLFFISYHECITLAINYLILQYSNPNFFPNDNHHLFTKSAIIDHDRQVQVVSKCFSSYKVSFPSNKAMP